MKRTVKKLDSKSKCQCLTGKGTRCTQGAVMIIMDRELSSLASKKVCKLHGFDILMEHCLELQAEIKSMECKSDAQLQREAIMHRSLSAAKTQGAAIAAGNLLGNLPFELVELKKEDSQSSGESFLYNHSPSVIQKIYDKVFKGGWL